MVVQFSQENKAKETEDVFSLCGRHFSFYHSLQHVAEYGCWSPTTSPSTFNIFTLLS